MNRPRFSPGALIFGLIFVAFGTLALLDSLDVLEFRAALVLPVLLIGLGLATLLSRRAGAEES